MAETIYNSTPARDGFHMPAEFEPQERVWMLWPQRPDNWRDGAKPAPGGVYRGGKGDQSICAGDNVCKWRSVSKRQREAAVRYSGGGDVRQ